MRTLRFTADSIYDLLKDDEVWIGEIPYFVEKSARGGMGFVLLLLRDNRRYHPRNFQLVHCDKVALKAVLQTDESPSIQQLFNRELSVWAGLDHPNIVNLDEIFETPKDGWVAAMKGCVGSLQQFLAEHGKFTPDDALFVLHNLMAGLQYAVRENGIFHLDLKPANVLFDHEISRIPAHSQHPVRKYRWLVSDWGLASARQAAIALSTNYPALKSRFQTLNNVGTEGYMAPERYTSGTRSSILSDVFSLGVILFEMLVGVLPYEPCAASVVDQVVSRSYVAFAKRRLVESGINTALSDVVLRMIEPDGSQRFQGYNDLIMSCRKALRRRNTFFARLFKS